MKNNPTGNLVPLYGLTIDSVSGLSNIVTSLKNLKYKPTTRIVFDEWVAATEYENAVNQIKPVSFIMGELLDSFYMNKYTVKQFTARVNEYVNQFGNQIDIYEIGNEINGDWLGKNSDVVSKMMSAYTICKSKGLKTALTLYLYSPDVQDSHEMFKWVNANVTANLKNGLDYVFVSYYEDDNNNFQPQWQQVFDSLHGIFPNSLLGIGECGTIKKAKKESYIKRYYGMKITTPNYIGGYFWWYGKQDFVPYTKPLFKIFNDAL